jgi:hypothetical protein
LYAVEGGGLWFATAAATLKVRMLSKRPQASAVIRAGDRSVVVSGEVESFDPMRPGDLARAARQGPAVARALARFGLRNAPDLAGFVSDTLMGRLGSRRPGRRVLLGLRPTEVAVLDGNDVVGAWGTWPAQPGASGQTTAEGGLAVVGWETEGGVLALPARWDPTTETAAVPPALVELAALPVDAAACVVADDYGDPGPAAKSGILLRGRGHREGGNVRFDAERVTAWDGIETTTEPSRS